MLPPNSNQYITLKDDEVVQSFQYSILVRGQYIFKVIVKDNAGNSMEKEFKKKSYKSNVTLYYGRSKLFFKKIYLYFRC